MKGEMGRDECIVHSFNAGHSAFNEEQKFSISTLGILNY